MNRSRTLTTTLCVYVGITLISFAQLGCAISHPCRDGGDTRLPDFNVKGDVRCKQNEFNGKWLNDGFYKQWFVNGALAIEGEFKQGLKEGIWLFYNENGSLKEIKFFDHDVERSPPDEYKKQIDLIILQKTGSKKQEKK